MNEEVRARPDRGADAVERDVGADEHNLAFNRAVEAGGIARSADHVSDGGGGERWRNIEVEQERRRSRRHGATWWKEHRRRAAHGGEGKAWPAAGRNRLVASSAGELGQIGFDEVTGG